MLVDNDRLVLRLKHELPKKRSWGTRELAELILNLEVECTLDDDPPQVPAAATEGPLGAAADKPDGSMPTRTDPLGAEGASNGNEAGNRDREAAGVR